MDAQAVTHRARLCSSCGQGEPARTFGADPRSRDGRQARCRQCYALEKKAKRADDPAYFAALEEARQEKRRPQRNAYMARRYRAKLAELRAAQSAYRRADPERIAQQKRAYAAAHPERIAAGNALRRARQAGAPMVERICRLAVAERDGYVCRYCRSQLEKHNPKSFHADHYIPLSRGGTHTYDNLVCSCPPCNLKKGSMTGDEFLDGLAKNQKRRAA